MQATLINGKRSRRPAQWRGRRTQLHTGHMHAGRKALLIRCTARMAGSATPLPPAARAVWLDRLDRQARAVVLREYSPGLPPAVFDELVRIETARLREIQPDGRNTSNNTN